MAMAELVFHDTEDTLTQYPRAPPPSPEAQQRSLGSIFEIPDGGFDPLDLRQQDFAVALDFVLTHNDVTRTNSNPSPLSTVPERGSPCNNDLTEDDEDYLGCPGSPMKRVCNSPSSFPDGYDDQLTNATHTTHTWTSPLHSYSPPLVSSRSSSSPAHACTSSLQQTSPYSIPQIPNGMSNGYTQEIRVARNMTVISDHCALSPQPQASMLSKSCDLPSSFPGHDEFDSMVTECRTRSYTLGTSKAEEDASQRRRKISLKRTNEERDCELQFSFEYSNGSSEESELLLVGQDTTALPIGKKACQPQQSPHIDFNINRIHQHFMYSSDNSASPSHHGCPPCSFNPTTHGPAHLRTTTAHSPPLLDVLTAQLPPPLVHVDSDQMMDTCDAENRIDSLDSMECGQSDQLCDEGTHTPQTFNNTLVRLSIETQNIVSTRSSYHSSQVSRHSFIDSTCSNALGTADCVSSNESFNFSKSL